MAEPSKIDRYEVLNVLGRGAFGVVYQCLDRHLERMVAVKVLLAAEHASQEQLDRFSFEAKTAAKLSHPHIVQIFDAGMEDSKPFLVMQYVEGKTLDALADDLRGDDLLSVLQLIYHLADALAYSHEHGIIHRDIKPSNIIVDSRGRPKLMDFGLARLADEARWLSATGDLIGTPRYMSPEQALMPSDEVDARTDIYSLGAIFYELLSKRPLVDGPTPLAVLKQLTDSVPPPIERWRPDLPPRCCEVIQRMIATDRDARFSTAAETAEAIKSLIFECAIAAPEIRSLSLPSVAHSNLEIAASSMRQSDDSTSSSRARRSAVRRGWREWTVVGISLATALAMIGWTLWSRTRDSIQPSAGGPFGTIATQVASEAIDAWKRRVDRLASTRDDRQYHSELNELREELNFAIRSRPNDGELRSLRGEVLLRNGDIRAAVEDWESAKLPASDPSIARLHLHALALWEKLILGSIAEESIGPASFPKVVSTLESAAEMDTDPAEAARLRSMADWISLAIGEQDFSPELEATLAVLPKNDPAFADVQTWRALVFLQYAEQLHYERESSPESDRALATAERDRWDLRAVQALREGLEFDVHHLGLLFLKSARWSRRLEWDTGDGTSWVDAEKRYKSAFESAFHRYRVAPAQWGLESAMGRAILLNQFGDNARALDHVSEFVDRGNAPPETIAFWVWLQLNQPPSDLIDATLATSLLKTTDPLVESSVPSFGIYLVRGICQSALGRVDEARRELLHGRSACMLDDWETVAGSFGEWLNAVHQSPAVFRDQTIETLWRFAVPESIRSQLQTDLLADLAQRADEVAPGLPEEDRRDLLAAGFFRMAKLAAERDDRDDVLRYTRSCLELRSPQWNPSQFQQDELLQAWNGDDEFRALLDEHAEEES